MISQRRGFGSDNHSGVHPKILESILHVNGGHMPAYDTDAVSIQCHKLFKDLFGEQTESYFVFNGTAANVLGLSAVVRPHHSILASEHAHVIVDECGAPEKHLGCKLIGIPSADAKLTPEMIKPYLIRRGDQHFSQPKVVSITQPTELGTLYTIDEIRSLAEFVHREGLYLHMDGARLVNAVAALGTSFREMTTDVGVDLLSLGGTKNGLLFGEAILFLRSGLNQDFKFIRKQAMQLASKTRFIASQFLTFLGTDLWLENAQHANATAQLLAQGLTANPQAHITQKVQVNSVFVIFPKAWIGKLREEAFFYVWNEVNFECRLMTSWDTQPDDIHRFLQRLSSLTS